MGESIWMQQKIRGKAFNEDLRSGSLGGQELGFGRVSCEIIGFFWCPNGVPGMYIMGIMGLGYTPKKGYHLLLKSQISQDVNWILLDPMSLFCPNVEFLKTHWLL